MSDARYRTASDGNSTFREDLFPELPEILTVLRSIDESLQTLVKRHDPGAQLCAISAAVQTVETRLNVQGRPMSP